jgi:tetratricopeptide (TPR) repeat protein
MPRAKPDRSFEIAVRHLFRHINDAAALRRNPLVRSFLDTDSTRWTDRAAVEKIRSQILHAAAICRTHEVASRLKTRVDRRYEIISAICSGERPYDTALRLGLSTRQYYRDRHQICMNVARLFMELRLVTLMPIEIREPGMQLVLRRAALLVEQGFAAKAVALLEKAIAQAESPTSETLARLSLVKALIQYGDIRRARESFGAARGLFEQRAFAMPDADLLRSRMSLTDIDIAVASGRDAEATATLESLAKHREDTYQGNPISDEIGLNIFLESCSHHLVNGRFAQARVALAKAYDLAARMAHTPPELAVYLAVYDASCCEDGSATPDVFVSRCYDALRVSISISSARGAMYAMIGLMKACLRKGNEGEAFKWLLQIVELARTMEGTKPLVSAALAAELLLDTRYWREAGSLFFEAQAFTRRGTLKWARLQGAQGKFFARSGKLHDALEALSNAADLTGSLRNRRQLANVLRERGIILHRLGRASESAECIRDALTLAERGTSALSLYQTYSAAATILSDDRLARRAKRMRIASSVTAAGGEQDLWGRHNVLAQVSMRRSATTVVHDPAIP